MPKDRPERDPDAPVPDPVEEAIEESFPASDPPAWSGHGTVREIPDDPSRPTPKEA